MAFRLSKRAFAWFLCPVVLLFAVNLYHQHTQPMTRKLSEVCQQAHATVARFSALEADDEVLQGTQRQVKHSQEVLSTMLEQHAFEEIAVSYNGGKDCLVMLILYLSVLHQRFSAQELDSFGTINAVLINYEQQFPELVHFIESTTEEYALQLTQYNTQLKQGFEQYLSKHPQTKTIVVGTRRTDPYAAHLKDIQRTDSGWPDFLRVHPVVGWSYAQIWCFLKVCQVPYCELYDAGYTSLGGVDTTVKNPLLRKENGEYSPAYLLEDGDARERDGRKKR